MQAPAPLGLIVGGVDAASLTLYEGKGDGTFSAPLFELVVPEVDGGFVDLAVADLNGDGLEDALAATFAAEQLVVALGDGPFHLGDAEVIDIGARPTRLLVRDITGDGAPDALVATGSGIVLLRGLGDGGFGATEHIATGEVAIDIVLLDTNGDRLDDVVAALPQANAVRVYAGIRGGGFVTGPEVTVAQPLALAVGEFTSDTRLDVAVYGGGSSEVFVLEGTSSGLQPPFSIASGITASRLIAADVNGDARADLIATDGQTGALQTLVGSGEIPFPVVRAEGTDPRTGIAVADFDSDGLADLVSIPLQAPEPDALPDPLPAAPPPCQGDCDHDKTVGTDELIVAVRLALGDGQFTCSALDRNGDLVVAIDEIIAAVENALSECSAN